MSKPRVRAPLVRPRALIVPGLTFILIMIVTLGLRNLSARLITENIERASQAESRKVVDLLKASLTSRMMVLSGVAFHMSASEAGQQSFMEYSARVLAESDDILAIAAIGADGRVQWVASEKEISVSQVSTMLKQKDALADTIDDVRLVGSYRITDPLYLTPHGRGFAAVMPYTRAGIPAGYVVGIFPYQGDAFDSLLSSIPQLRDFKVEVRQAETFFQTVPLSTPDSMAPRRWFAPKEPPKLGVKEAFTLGYQRWDVTVEPVGFQASSNPLVFSGPMATNLNSGAILLLGSLLAFLVSAASYRQQLVAVASRDEALHSRTRLASASDQLAIMKEELDLILNNVDEGIILYDDQLAPLQSNVAFKRLFSSPDGPNPLDLDSEKHHRVMSMFFKNEAQYWALLNNLRENPELPLADEIEFRSPKGPLAPIHYQRRATSVIGPDGARRGYLVIYQDKTPSRTAERLKEDFLASVAHDLRTPLSAIKGFAETMNQDSDMPGETREEFTSIICAEATRLQEMIEDLLDLRRLEEGRTDLAASTYNLRAVVEDVVRASKPLLEAHDITVESDWGGEIVILLIGDVAKISRCVRNVLNNAIKYSPAHSVIHVRAVFDEDRVELSVTDEGPGIAAEEIPHVFEKFYRGAEHVRRTQGTGLGLAIVKHIVESHSGVVSVSSEPGQGATIKIVLPRDNTLRLSHLPEAGEPASDSPKAESAT